MRDRCRQGIDGGIFKQGSTYFARLTNCSPRLKPCEDRARGKPRCNTEINDLRSFSVLWNSVIIGNHRSKVAIRGILRISSLNDAPRIKDQVMDLLEGFMKERSAGNHQQLVG